MYIVAQHLWPLPALAAVHDNLQVRQDAPLQTIVTWDEYSILCTESVSCFSPEFHPFRLPSPGLWLDILQKVRALGYFAVSFYLDWDREHIRTEGIFALDQFFKAASEAGIYLIARPGLYINSEVSGGGFPGWLGRLGGRLKTTDSDYLDSITPYIRTTGHLIAQADYSWRPVNNMTITSIDSPYFEKELMAYVQEQYWKAGIVVPFIINDAFQVGNFAPGTGLGAGDIYSFDSYPLGWEPGYRDSSNWSKLIDPWLMCNFSNLNMLFGGTNWGNLGHPGGYTSYIGSAIAENRQVHSEKYSELKLQAHFLHASPQLCVSRPETGTTGVYTTTKDLTVSRLAGRSTDFYVVRHSDLKSRQSRSVLRLNGRDSKFHVVDYDVGGVNLKSWTGRVLVLYGGENEVHEFALHKAIGRPTNIEGDGLKIRTLGEIHLLSRNEAYNYWLQDLPNPVSHDLYVSPSTAERSVLVKAGYLLRSAKISGHTLSLSGDITATTKIELISAPSRAGATYTLTVPIDHMGLDLNFPANIQTMKDPRGILDYALDSRDKESIFRGPLNEGALYAERQGYQLPGAPTNHWEQTSPIDGLSSPRVGFFVTHFDLSIPEGYDVPISVFRFPIPEGILNHNGPNVLGSTVWLQEDGPVALTD
ncbi:glycoside hydrolase superfamily [Aspergillus similis]